MASPPPPDGADTATAAADADAPDVPSCPICTCDMDLHDASYPMLCPTQCGYNFCTDCAQLLVRSSEDGYEMASDGSRQVKVRLLCPQCRGDLSSTIADTVLVRAHLRASEKYGGVPDSELGAAELQLKHGGAAAEAELAKAQERYGAWARRLHGASAAAVPPGGRAVAPGRGECGEQAGDKPGGGRVAPLSIDTTVFNGLESAMTEEEQRFVTQKMTSGNPARLAEAAQILAGISEMNLKGVTPSMRSRSSSASPTFPPQNMPRPRPAQRPVNLQRGRSNHNGAVNRALNMAKSDLERAKEAKIAAHRKRHPLPVRMPRFATIEAFDPTLPPRKCPLTFADDEWDGSIADAFARLRVGRGGKVVRKKIDPLAMEGVCNVLMAGEQAQKQDANMQHTSGTSNRVVVGTSQALASRKGILQGDVITHVNGEPFCGTSEDLRALIAQVWRQEGKGGTFDLVVNAEPCTAEALRLRALVI